MTTKSKSQAWCFTLFTKLVRGQYSPTFVYDEDNMVYAVMQVEECPTTNRLHFQGYVEFKNRVGFQRVKRLLQSDSVNIRPAKGSSVKNKEYCTKEETRVDGPWEFGETLGLEGQGARSDIRKFLDEALSVSEVQGTTPPEFSGATHVRDVDGFVAMFSPVAESERSPFGLAVEKHTETFVKFHKGLAEACAWLRKPVPFSKPYVIWIWGPTGVGKTRQVYHFDRNTFRMPYGKEGSLWYDGYTDQQTILIDELREGRLPTDWLLQFLDGYEFQLEVKGSFRRRNCKYIFITSCYPPEEIWGAAGIEYPQVMRRINKVYQITEEFEILCEK